jgi:hypothetical protein
MTVSSSSVLAPASSSGGSEANSSQPRPACSVACLIASAASGGIGGRCGPCGAVTTTFFISAGRLTLGVWRECL